MPIEPGTLADEVLSIVHAFGDRGRKDAVRSLAVRVARLTRERDEARAAYASASREWAERHEHARERILGLTRERDLAADEINRLMTEATYAENARLTASLTYTEEQRDEARAEVTRLRGVIHTYMTSHDEQIAQSRLALIGQSVRERDTALRELHRLTHGEDIEGDGVCRHEIDAQAARAERAQLACEVSDLLIEVGRLTASLADERARATEMHRRAQAAEGQLGRVERLRESHAVEVGRLISRRRWDVSLWRGRYQQARRWSRLWHREARRLWREVQALSEHVEVDQ